MNSPLQPVDRSVPLWTERMLAARREIGRDLVQRLVDRVQPNHRGVVRAEAESIIRVLLPPAIRRLARGASITPSERQLLQAATTRLGDRGVPPGELTSAVLYSMRGIKYTVRYAAHDLPLPEALLVAERSHATMVSVALIVSQAPPSRTADEGEATAATTATADALTSHQVAVLKQVALGRSNRKVADALGLREKTVRNHLHHIYPLIGVTCRSDATRWWIGGGDKSGRRS